MKQQRNRTSGARSAILLLALAPACAGVRPVERVLGDSDRPVSAAEGRTAAQSRAAAVVLLESDALAAYARARIAAMDERCRVLLEEAAAEGAPAEVRTEAARALMLDADLRVQLDVALRFDPADLPSVDELIDAEDDVPRSVRSDVRSFADRARRLADSVLEETPEEPTARLFQLLGTGLFLWSVGPLEALANGAMTSLPRGVTALAAEHPAFEEASPLRLKGRFQTRAPWPFKDVAGAVETLTQAVEIAPIPLNLLFLGDALWRAKRAEEARDAWRRATEAPADPRTADAAPLIREIARLRLLASD